MAVMVWLAAEVTRRNQVALAAADIEGRVHADVGPRIFVICEELNATQNRLKAWWNQEMEMKGRSPGSMALDEVMFLGRQVARQRAADRPAALRQGVRVRGRTGEPGRADLR